MHCTPSPATITWAERVFGTTFLSTRAASLLPTSPNLPPASCTTQLDVMTAGSQAPNGVQVQVCDGVSASFRPIENSPDLRHPSFAMPMDTRGGEAQRIHQAEQNCGRFAQRREIPSQCVRRGAPDG